jgi:hypothetical protein
VLIVDGIDTRTGGAARTEEDMWMDFGLEGKKLLDKGYDVLVLNYVYGDDYIQRNAYALLTVLQNYVPGYMAPGHENDRVAIVAASMGTQVTRYALVTAEQKLNQDHHTGLAIYLDGPFLGANIPWSSQGLLQFLGNNKVMTTAQSKTAEDAFNDVLQSPAAKQLLRAGIDYAPDPTYNGYYAEMSLFQNAGLPQLARNVAVSCGSGSGISQVPGYSETFPSGIEFAYLNTGQQKLNSWVDGFNTWANFGVDAWAEGPTQQAPQQQVLSVHFEGGPYIGALTHIGISPYAKWPGYKVDSAIWNILEGARPSDFSPGGFTTLSKTVVDGYNKNAPGPLTPMTGFGRNTFIPVFSALYVRSAETTNEPIKANQDYPDRGGIVNLIGYNTPVYRKHADFWYGPEAPGEATVNGTIDPLTPVKSPFDAIWYQATNNIEHVFNLGNLPPPGYEAFLLNELDQFTANEPFTTESVLNTQPKMPLHEEYLPGDLLNTGVDELLTINTLGNVTEYIMSGTAMQGTAMVQSFNVQTLKWMDMWDNIPTGRHDGPPGWIGAWPINKGDKFFLAQLQVPGPKLLISFSAATSAWAMVQRFNGSSWVDMWDNFGNGQFGTGTIQIRPTDLYAFGDPDSSGFDKLLVVYPYVCSDGLEKTVPGTSGLSKASLLTFTGSGWTENWNNSSSIDFVGAAAIRFGDRLMFGRIPTTPTDPTGDYNSLFSINLLRGIFGGPTWLQRFTSPTWSTIWDIPINNPNQNIGGDCPSSVGWPLGQNPRDSFYFADLFGLGHDELIAANDANFEVWDYVLCPSPTTYTWVQDGPYANPGNGSQIGVYKLSIGDRFVFGHFTHAPGDMVLSLNPLPQGFYRGPAVLQQYTSNGGNPWNLIWASTTSLNPATSVSPPMLGHWPLYQDLP